MGLTGCAVGLAVALLNFDGILLAWATGHVHEQ